MDLEFRIEVWAVNAESSKHKHYFKPYDPMRSPRE